MKYSSVRLQVLLAAAVVVGPPSIKAQLFYAATGGAQGGDLYIIDGSGALVNHVGALVDSELNPFALTGLARQPSTGSWYGVTSGLSPTRPSWLVQIDEASAEVTPVGALSVTMGDIAFNATSGVLYGTAEGGDLHTIDLLTGFATRLGPSGVSGTSGYGLAEGPIGNLVTTPDGSFGGLYIYDKSTGAASQIAALTGAPVAGPIYALAFAPGGLYGINGRDSGDAPTHLIWITTSGITDLGETLGGLDALAAVPEPSTYAIIFGFGLAASITLRRRRNTD